MAIILLWNNPYIVTDFRPGGVGKAVGELDAAGRPGVPGGQLGARRALPELRDRWLPL